MTDWEPCGKICIKAGVGGLIVKECELVNFQQQGVMACTPCLIKAYANVPAWLYTLHR